MRSYVVSLSIADHELERYYRGTASSVRTRATTGAIIQFPATVLRPFVGRAGVHGVFELQVNSRGRLVGIRRC